MTTPQSVLDRIAELEAELEESALEMIRTSGAIADLRQQIQKEEEVQARARGQLDLLRFVVEQYAPLVESGESAHRVINAAFSPTMPACPVCDGETTGNGSHPISTKERVYAAMAQLEGPATATQIAEVIGATDYRTVAPVFAVLKREGKIKAAPEGGWIRTAALATPAAGG